MKLVGQEQTLKETKNANQDALNFMSAINIDLLSGKDINDILSKI